VHAKSPAAQEVRALLVARKLLQTKLLDVEFSIRGILRGFGLKMGEVSKGRFVARVRELAAGHAMLERITEPMLRAREALRTEYARLHGEMLAIARPDPVCRRLMTVPGVGALVAITFKSAVDDPGRFARSRVPGAHFGSTPRKMASSRSRSPGPSRTSMPFLIQPDSHIAAPVGIIPERQSTLMSAIPSSRQASSWLFFQAVVSGCAEQGRRQGR
jgi:transposase